MDSSNYRQTIVRRSMVFNQNGSTFSNAVNTSATNGNLGRSYIQTTYDNYGDDLRKSRITNLPNYKKNSLGDNPHHILVFQAMEIERLSLQIEVLRVKNKQYERRILNAQSYEVQIRQLTQRCFAQERDMYEYKDEHEKLNKICETLYHENEMLKNKLSEMDFSLKQRYESEVSKNTELMHDLEKWKMRCTAIEKSKSKELQDLRAMLESQRKSMVDREIRQATIRFQNERSTLENEIRKAREQLENRVREIEDLKQKCQKYQIHIMQLRNYQNVIVDNENKLALLNNQVYRLNDLLKDRDNDINNLRGKQQKLSQQIKEQRQWEFQSKQLKSSLQAKTREADEWRVRVNRLEEEVTRGKQLQLYKEQLMNKLNLAMKEVDRLNIVLKTKLEEIESWKRKLNEKENEISRYKNMQNQIYTYESKLKNLQIENDRINGILKSRLGEIEEWKSRHNSLEQTIKTQAGIQKDKKSLEDKYSQQIKQNEELKFMISKFESDINGYRRNENQMKDLERNNQSLTKELERLNNLLKTQGGELNDFRIRYSKIENTLNEYKSIEMKMKDYENKINLLNLEHSRLNDLLRERNDLINKLESDSVQAVRKINHYKNYEIKISENQQVVRKLQDNAEKLKKDLDNWQNKYKESENKSRQFENILFKTNQEKEKLNSMVRAKNSEYEELRNQYSRLEPEIRRRKQMQIQIQQYENHLNGLLSDKQAYERKLRSMEQDLEKEKAFTNQFAFKIIVLSSEIERIHQQGTTMGKNKSKEYLELQESYTKLQSKVQSKNSEIDMLISKITSLESRINQMTNDYTRILREVERSEQESKNLIRQIEEYQDYARRIAILGKEIDRLTQLNKAAEEDIKRMRLKYSGEMDADRRQENMLLKIFLMTIEIEALREQVAKKLMTEDDMRKSYLEPIRRIQ